MCQAVCSPLPITQIGPIKAYEDIVVQLQTAYVVTYRSDLAAGVSPD